MNDWHRERYGDPCRECGFAWTITQAEALALADDIPARYAALLEGHDGTEQHPNLSWSAGAYVSHVTDNFRIWAERLAAASHGSDTPLVPYDDQGLAEARGYGQLSLAGALWSLDRAEKDWHMAVALAERAHAVLHHPNRSEQTVAEVVVGNVHDAVHHKWDIERSLRACGPEGDPGREADPAVGGGLERRPQLLTALLRLDEQEGVPRTRDRARLTAMTTEGREPFATGRLEVGGGHIIYWEQVGSPRGVPVVYLHGGPGSGCSTGIRRAFDPERHHVVLFDQRAAGRSNPHASEDYLDWSSIDMDHHVADIEALREHLDIDSWIVFGVSWGSVLGATYAERHPNRVRGVVLGAVSLGRTEDIDWLTVDVGRFFPEEWRAFRDHVPERLRGFRLVDAYNELLMDPDLAVRDAAASAWCDWESAHIATTPMLARRNPRYDDPSFRLGFARQVTHCWRNDSWLAPDEIVANAHRLAGIPGCLITGRLDLSGPLDGAWRLHRAWPDSDLVIVDDEGHSGVGMFSRWAHALAELAGSG